MNREARSWDGTRRFKRQASGQRCCICERPIKAGGYVHYCSRQCYMKAFRKYRCRPC